LEFYNSSLAIKEKIDKKESRRGCAIILHDIGFVMEIQKKYK